MKQKTTFIICFICLTFCCLSGIRSQWVQTNGPYGGMMSALFVKGSNLFAGVYRGGVYRSLDSGITWKVSGLRGRDIGAFTSNGAYLFAASTGQEGKGGI